MGICQCLEINNSEIHSTEKDLLEKREMEDNPENAKLVKMNRNNKLYSSYNNFNKLTNKNKNFQSEMSKSEILFEDISFTSKTHETTSIDYYQISKNVFDLLNSIRMNPERCLNSLNTLINEIIPNDLNNAKEIEKELKNNYASVNSNYNTYNSNNYLSNGLNTSETIGSLLRENETHNKLIDVRDFFSEIVENFEKNTDLIMWSEKVYLTAYEYLVDVEEKLTADTENVKESSSNRISSKLRNNYNCIEFNVNGLQSPEVIVLFLLIENKARLKSILNDNYDYGAVCTFPTKNNMKARTLLYLVSKNTKNQKVYGINPFNGKQQDLSVYEPIFQRINYKNNIVDGFYESDGIRLKVIFNLIDGEKREEVFDLS